MKRFALILLLLFFSTPISALDLEKMAQSFVIETKKIKVPGYPNAFNPSIVRLPQGFLMSFRHIPNPAKSFNSEIGLIWLDQNFDPIGSAQLLDIRNGSLIPSRAEDARLLTVGDCLFLVYSDNEDEKITKGGFRLFFAQLKYEEKKFSLHHIEKLSKFEGESKDRREKNWVPFDYKGILFLAYSIDPHKIFRPLLDFGQCETFCETDQQIQWNWGELRGGTPALKVGNEYLAFFHSQKKMATEHSEGKEMLHYFMGAYTFSTEPPFELTRISPQPIVGKGFYKGPMYKPYWGSVRVVFPCGYVFDDKFIWIAYGRQDHEIWIVKVEKERLLKSLVPVFVTKKGENL